jgi:hypothetical protein
MLSGPLSKDSIVIKEENGKFVQHKKYQIWNISHNKDYPSEKFQEQKAYKQGGEDRYFS